MFNNLCISDLCPRIFRYTTHFLFTSASGSAFISPIPPPWRYLSSLFLWGALGSFVCVQRCEAHLLRPGGHLGIKKCQTTGHSPYRPPLPQGQPTPTPHLLAPVNEALLLRPPTQSVKNCIMHKLFWFHSAWGKYAYATPISPGEQLFIKKSSLIVWKEIMLILHFRSAS